MKKNYILIILFFLSACNFKNKKKLYEISDINNYIKIDTINLKKMILLEYVFLDSINFFQYKDDGYNCIINIKHKWEDKELLIFQDSIYINTTDEIIEDVNKDGIKDIALRYGLCIGSNCRYCLYLISENKVIKCKGFEEILNPIYNKKYEIFESYVVNNHSYTTFYKIQKDSVVNLGYIFYGNIEDSLSYYSQKNKILKSFFN